MTANHPHSASQNQANFEKSAAAALAVILLLALVVVIFLNFIPYNLAASWIVSKVPGLKAMLNASSAIVFPVAVSGVAASVYFFTRGIVGASKRQIRSKKAKYLPFITAFIAVAVCILSEAPADSIFVACLGVIAGALITLIQFQWVLFQHNAKQIADSIQHEKAVPGEEDEDLRIATRSERQKLKHQNNVALVIDALVSVCVYPPVAWSMLPIVVLTMDFSALNWGNIIMIFVTTVLTGLLLRFYLGQAKKAQG